MSNDLEKTYRHESYGMIGIARQSGGGRLFGSVLPNHHTQITLRIMKGKRVCDARGHVDRYHADGMDSIIEVVLSAAQYAEMISTPNVGSGVPCTIRTRDGVMVEPPPPDVSTELEESRESVKASLESRVKRLQASRAKLDEVLAKKSLTASDRDQIKWIIDQSIQEFESNVPFAVEQFQRAADRVASAAKAEFDAFATHAIMQRGLDGLAEDRAAQLPAHESERTVYGPRDLARTQDKGLPHGTKIKVMTDGIYYELNRRAHAPLGEPTQTGVGRWVQVRERDRHSPIGDVSILVIDHDVQAFEDMLALDDAGFEDLTTVKVDSTGATWTLDRGAEAPDGHPTKSGVGRWIELSSAVPDPGPRFPKAPKETNVGP